jgi:hypothetical protein
MRNIVMLVLSGAALIFSVLAYQRVEELSEVVARLSTDANRESVQRNRVLSLGNRLEKALRSLGGSSRQTPPASK